MRRVTERESRLRAACCALRGACCMVLELASLAALFRSTQHAARSTRSIACLPLGG